MKFARPCSAALLLAAISACSGSDAHDRAPSSSTDSSTAPGTNDVAPNDDGAIVRAASSGEGNASITLGDHEYRFTTLNCAFDDIDGDDVSGVIDIDGVPAFVEFGVSSSSGIIALNVGLSEDTPRDETLEESLEHGLEQVWNLFYEADTLANISDTTIRGTGEFLLVLTTGAGSSGDTLPGAFEADCS